MAKYGSKDRYLRSVKLQAKILINQFGRCGYCNSSLSGQRIHWDHFIPWSYLNSSGGEENWVASCLRCNKKKSSRIFTSTEQILNFCSEMVSSHGSFGEGWPEDTEHWQTTLKSAAGKSRIANP